MSNLLIYQSSAGSGKTYKLAKEYLKLAFRFPGAFKSILAITFTNKATDEMKSRVLKFLADLSNDKDEELKKQLIEEGVKCDIKEQAKLTLLAILHNYSDFSISTIDSFFNRVLRSFAKELKLQIGYDIELDTSEVLKKITEMLFKDLNKDEDLRQYLESFILSKINEDKGWEIEKDIVKLGEEIFKERYWEKKFLGFSSEEQTEIIDSRKKIKTLFRDIDLIQKNFEENLRKIGDESEQVMKKYSLVIDDFSNKESGVMGFLLNKIRYKKDYNLKDSKRAVSVYNDNTGWYAQKSNKKNIIQQAVDDGLYSLLKEAIEYIREKSVMYYSAKELKNILFTLGIFEDLISKLNEYRKVENVILQSDVNNILQGLISEENSPFIYEKIGSNFKNILVDEFQDTSTFQWKNLLPLIVNALSEKNTALVVGDVKQSVYRWRSGNMKLLLSQIYEDLSGFKELFKTEYLKTNRRSCREIVEFNNRFFLKAIEKIAGDVPGDEYKKLLVKAYNMDSVTQDFKKENGYVDVCFFDDDDGISSKEKSEKKILEIIKDALEDNYKLSDILVLVRKNSEASEISGFLTKSGYGIVSSESLMVNNSPKVRMVVDLIKYICDNQNAIAKTDALYNYLEFVLKEKFEYSRLFENIDELFPQKIPGGFFKENESPKIKPVLNDLSVYEVCENLIGILGFDSVPDPYLIKFLNIILEYSSKNCSDLASFILWWDENKLKHFIDNPSGTDAINIMTIHKAKGLQGKIVIIPYANWKINLDGTKDLIWVSSGVPPFDKSSAYPVKAVKNLENTYFKEDYDYEYAQTKLDNLNLLYVAFTRAEDRLYALVPQKRTKDKIGEVIKNVLNEIENSDKNEYIAGQKEKSGKGEKENGPETVIMEHSISNEWYKKIIVKPGYKKIREFIDEEFAFKTNRGVIIHSVLAYMKSAGDIDSAIEKIYYNGLISVEQKEKVKTQLTNIFKNPVIRSWFSDEWEIKTENEILLKDGKILRPDRVIIKGKQVKVIDFKTGAENEEHKKQITQYGEILKKMGYSEVSKFLLYIDYDASENAKIVEVN
jgi:ATP-dependent helicase/nuclease subunit A